MAAGMVAFMHELTESASRRHGSGTVVALLESLDKAHAVHTEVTPHGFFVKMFFAKQRSPISSDRTSPTRALSSDSNASAPPVSQSGVFSKYELLNMRPPPGLPSKVLGCQAKRVEVFKISGEDSDPDLPSPMVPSISGNADYTIKNTFVHIDTYDGDPDAVSVVSAPATFKTSVCDPVLHPVSKNWRCHHCGTRLESPAAICRYCKDKTVAVAYARPVSNMKLKDVVEETGQKRVNMDKEMADIQPERLANPGNEITDVMSDGGMQPWEKKFAEEMIRKMQRMSEVVT